MDQGVSGSHWTHPGRRHLASRRPDIQEGACLPPLPYGPMRLFIMFLVVLLLIGGGMKLAGAQIPILDFPFGGPMGQPQIEVVEPNLNLP